MTPTINQYRPDYAIPPGEILEEHLEVLGISHAEFARRCGRSPKLISEIVSGKAPLEPKTALQFEKVLGIDASVWLGIETKYRLHQMREIEAAGAAQSGAWLKAFPIKDLVKRGVFPRPESDTDTFSKLLSFFGVGSIEAWHLKYSQANVAYRHSPSFKSDEASLATWLRLGEIAAEKQECAPYNNINFKHALSEIRSLTRAPIEKALPKAQELCNQSGVALVLIKPFSKTRLSGAARWIAPRKAVIQLSARHKSDDHLWFSFFHEAAHIHLHSKKGIFIDGANENDADIETEANNWAANTLIPRPAWESFVEMPVFRKVDIQDFAENQGISPGIVVGMLQHNKYLPWTQMNDLKIRYRWQEE